MSKLGMRLRFRLVLPASLGCVAVALMIWDLLNQRVIEAMGMGLDTGAPVWPYQASFLLLQAINAPAFMLASPFFSLPHMQLENARYPVLFPVILIWWWWLGTRIDFGILGREHYPRPKSWAALLAAMAAGLLYVGTWIVLDEVHRWLTYGPLHPLQLIRTVGLTMWSSALACGCLLAAVRLLQGRFPAVTERGRRRPILAYGFAFVALVAGATSLIGIARETRIDADSCVPSNDSGCVHGTVADENGKAVKGIEVEVLRADKAGEARWSSMKYGWTDGNGRYSVNELQPGEYLIAVHYYGAPNERQPLRPPFTGERNPRTTRSVSWSG